ncbi:3'-5' exonuclease [Paraglaciecola aquimarina]|uniref:DNA-directed DNA polymerase n=1 Tax=Paraglaciecola aquimarina TaxID=1235557 RepID=A0ABU3SYD9_9ALTE|nr:3'-5' exonuclease [Paraglaciecola aquimarina]MDU0355034.1 3'-5' exonuclease [Paraglaciecola aquimarina]
MSDADTVIVLDFETTGLSPDYGDRAIEIGAVKIQNGIIVDRFQALMNPGKPISRFIEDYTGITNQMLTMAAPCDEVMEQFADFIAGFNLVAHNASFDKRFLDAELSNIYRPYSGQFSCSMLVARRLFQQAPSHKLSSLVALNNIQVEGEFHRALFDAEMTAKLWLVMLEQLSNRFALVTVPFQLTQKLSKTPKKQVHKLLKSYQI